MAATFVSSESSSTTTTTAVTTIDDAKHKARRSFSLKLLIGIADFSSLVVRSNSTTLRRKNPRGQSQSVALYSGYADTSSSVDNHLFVEMQQHEERPSRNLKKENKLYNFLTSSRSRSRSKNEHSTPDHSPMLETTALKSRTQPTSSLGRRSGASMVGSGSRPPTRVQSRPLSSTTTTTNATVTPSTPKARRYHQPPVEKTRPSLTPVSKTKRLDADETVIKPKRRFQDLFSISLGSLSRSRSRSHSRPGSPRASLDVPPLPATTTQDDEYATPRPRKSFSPHGARRLVNRSPSPTPTGPKVLRVVNATATTNSSTGSTAASIKITKLFTKGSTTESKPSTPPIPTNFVVSQPLKRVSSLRRRSSLKDDEAGSHTNLPKLVHTPPTPLKGVEAANPPNGIAGKSRMRHQSHAAKGSLDSALRSRAPAAASTMGVVDEEGRSEVGSLNFTTKGKAREGATSPPLPPLPRPPGLIRLSNSARSTKHGSFDFERPGWSSVAPTLMQRSGSGGTSGSTVSGEMKEKAGGPGMAGVGTSQRELSMRRMQEEQEKNGLKEKEREKKILPIGQKGKEKENLFCQRTTPSDQLHASTSTAGTTNGTGGKSSSMSKATGKRYTHVPGGTGKTGSGSGLPRLMGGHPHHGLFSFEPPVPTSTPMSWSTGTGGSTGTSGKGYGHLQREEDREKTKREYERVQLERGREKERQRDVKRKGLKVGGDRPAVPVPSIPSMPTIAGGGVNGALLVGHRPGTKGRSLDLGLGLAWASSKVPEEALLPPSAFFVGSLSNGRSTENGNGSSTGHSSGKSSRNGRRDRAGPSWWDEEVERSKLGKEVAKVFRDALDAEAYRLFKSYVHQFDAHEIPFDGPNGIVMLVERLLARSAPDLRESEKRRLLDKLIKIILQHS